MPTRRLIFVPAPRQTGLAPIVLAIAFLLCLAMAEFVLAFWPGDAPPRASQSAPREIATAAGDRLVGQAPVDSGAHRKPARPWIWM